MHSAVFCCAAFNCRTTSLSAPKKLFVYIPMKKLFCPTVDSPPRFKKLMPGIYLCEDHFDFPKDMDNNCQYRVTGPLAKIDLKSGWSTSKLECESAIIVRPEMTITSKCKELKGKKRILSDKVMKERDMQYLLGARSGQICSVQLYRHCYDHMIKSSSQPTITTMKDSPKRSGDLAKHFEREALICRVYNYLQTEYELLKSLNANNDCDLSPLSNILQRTAEAIGITQKMVAAVLNKEKPIKRSCSQHINSEHNYIINNSIRREHTATAENTEDNIPDFTVIEHNSEECMIKEENIEIGFESAQHNTEEIRIEIDKSLLDSTNFIIDEYNTKEFRMRERNTEDFRLRDDNTEDFRLPEYNTEDDRIDDFAVESCREYTNEELIMKCEVFDDPIPLSGSSGYVTQHTAQTQVEPNPEDVVCVRTRRPSRKKLESEASLLKLKLTKKKGRPQKQKQPFGDLTQHTVQTQVEVQPENVICLRTTIPTGSKLDDEVSPLTLKSTSTRGRGRPQKRKQPCLVKKEYVNRKRQAQLQREPDSPPRKKQTRRSSPVEDPCLLESEHILELQAETIQDAQPEAIQDAQLEAIQDAQPEVIQDAQPEAIQDVQLEAIQDAQPEIIQDAQPEAIQDVQLEAIQDAQPEALQGVHPEAVDAVVEPEPILAIIKMDLTDEEFQRVIMTDVLDDDSDVDIDLDDDDYSPPARRHATTEPACEIDMTRLDTSLLQAEDELNDRILRDVVPSDDYYNFDWKDDRTLFIAQRETFTGNSGPTFDMTDMTPRDLFYKVFDTDFVDMLCKETNRYAEQKIANLKADNNLLATTLMHRWTPTDRDEMITFLAILILQHLYPRPEEETYFKFNAFGTMPYFSRIMTYNRFLMLKSFYHFVDNQTLTDKTRLCKIKPVIDYLNEKFSTLYLPAQEITIDECLLKWHGRLNFVQKIATKASQVGVKSYELYECRTGYLWKFFVYVEKNSQTTDRTKDGTCERLNDETIGRLDNVVTDQRIVETADQPVVAIADQPVVQIADQPVEQIADQLVVQIADQPVVQIADQPVVQIADQPVVEIADQPVVQIADQPVVQIADQPVVEIADQPVVQIADQPVVEIADQPVVQIADQPVVQIADQPVVEIADQPVVQIADQPVVQIADQPVVQIADQPVVQIADQPVVEIADQLFVETAEKPVVKTTDRPHNDILYRLQYQPDISFERPTNATLKIIIDLVEPLLHRGHTLVMDNFYNSPLFLRWLKTQKTDCYGTLRLDRESISDTFKLMTKNDLRQGEVFATYSTDLSLMLWRDANLVSMISTYHQPQVGLHNKLKRMKDKPKIVLDYNRSMAAVDRKNHILSHHHLQQIKNTAWYKKVFCRLFSTAVFNAFVIFSTNDSKMIYRTFRTVLAEDLIKSHRLIDLRNEPRLFGRTLQNSETNTRPIDQDHFPERAESSKKRCWMCSRTQRNPGKRTAWKCRQCNVSLCIIPCFREYHKPK